MVGEHEECRAHAGIVERITNHDQVVAMLRDEIEKMRKTLNWLSVAIAAMALSTLGADGIGVVQQAAKLVGQ